ncbi:hypothetical protein FC697_19775 [Bacillus wiedmannii]|uniref:hypothetical protein n=1 Tax=Bacillus wiedmannii TaxID=1890302 RepID=UPI0010BE0F3D|nr:hypothetical protein [Bacillus wiedmannii]TKH19861.1 hypothetical protein FC697_19775 [Bacillus wiedmannii]
MRHALFGFALLSGIVMAGGNPASAEEHPFLKDSNGEPAQDGRYYYMEPYEFPGQTFVYDMRYAPEYYSSGHSVKLGSSSGKRISFNWYGDGDVATISTEERYLFQGTGYNHVQLLGKKPNTDEVQLRFSNGIGEQWVVTKSSDGNYFSLQNAEDHMAGNQKFLSYSNPGEWLNVDQSTMNSKTMWRLTRAPR